MTDQAAIPETGDFNINTGYGVTISKHSEAVGQFVALGSIFERDTMTLIGREVLGEGETWPVARSRAMAAAWRIATDLSV